MVREPAAGVRPPVGAATQELAVAAQRPRPLPAGPRLTLPRHEVEQPRPWMLRGRQPGAWAAAAKPLRAPAAPQPPAESQGRGVQGPASPLPSLRRLLPLGPRRAPAGGPRPAAGGVPSRRRFVSRRGRRDQGEPVRVEACAKPGLRGLRRVGG